jgi:hypothetical protein
MMRRQKLSRSGGGSGSRGIMKLWARIKATWRAGELWCQAEAREAGKAAEATAMARLETLRRAGEPRRE